MRMTIQVDVNSNDDGDVHDDNIEMLYIEGGGFYLGQGKATEKRPSICITDRKQAKALVMGIKALAAASGWKV